MKKSMDQTVPKSSNFSESKKNDFGRSFGYGIGQSRKDNDWFQDDRSKRNDIGRSRGATQGLGETRRDDNDLGYSVYESRKTDRYSNGSLKEDYESTKDDDSLRNYDSNDWRNSRVGKQSAYDRNILSQTENAWRYDEYSKSRREESNIGRTFRDIRPSPGDSSRDRQPRNIQGLGKSSQADGVRQNRSEDNVSTRQSTKHNMGDRNHGETWVYDGPNGPGSQQDGFDQDLGRSRFQRGEYGWETRSMESLPEKKDWRNMASSDTFRRAFFDVVESFRPQISVRANYKDYDRRFRDDSLYTSSSSSSTRRLTCGRCGIITVIILTLAAIAGAITLAVILTRDDSTQSGGKAKFVEVALNSTVQEQFISEYSNTSSSEFANFSTSFCNAMQTYSNNASNIDDINQCIVDNIRNGSCIVSFRLVFISTATVTTTTVTEQIQSIFNTSSSSITVGVFVFVQVTVVQAKVKETVDTDPIPPTQATLPATTVTTTQTTVSTSSTSSTGASTGAEASQQSTIQTATSSTPLTSTNTEIITELFNETTISDNYTDTTITPTTMSISTETEPTPSSTDIGQSAQSTMTTTITETSTMSIAPTTEADTSTMTSKSSTETESSTMSTTPTSTTETSTMSTTPTTVTETSTMSTTPTTTTTETSTMSTTPTTTTETGKMSTTPTSTTETSTMSTTPTTVTETSTMSTTPTTTVTETSTMSTTPPTTTETGKMSTTPTTTTTEASTTSTTPPPPTTTETSTMSTTPTTVTETSTMSTTPTTTTTETSTMSTTPSTVAETSTMSTTETETSTTSTTPTTVTRTSTMSTTPTTTTTETSTMSTTPTTATETSTMSTTPTTVTETSTMSTTPTTVTETSTMSTTPTTVTETSTMSTTPTTVTETSIMSTTPTTVTETSTMSTTPTTVTETSTTSTTPTTVTERSTTSTTTTTTDTTTMSTTETETSTASTTPTTVTETRTMSTTPTTVTETSTMSTTPTTTTTETSTMSTTPTTVTERSTTSTTTTPTTVTETSTMSITPTTVTDTSTMSTAPTTVTDTSTMSTTVTETRTSTMSTTPTTTTETSTMSTTPTTTTETSTMSTTPTTTTETSTTSTTVSTIIETSTMLTTPTARTETSTMSTTKTTETETSTVSTMPSTTSETSTMSTTRTSENETSTMSTSQSTDTETSTTSTTPSMVETGVYFVRNDVEAPFLGTGNTLSLSCSSALSQSLSVKFVSSDYEEIIAVYDGSVITTSSNYTSRVVTSSGNKSMDLNISDISCGDEGLYVCESVMTDGTRTNASLALQVYGKANLDVHPDFVELFPRLGYNHVCSVTIVDSGNAYVKVQDPSGAFTTYEFKSNTGVFDTTKNFTRVSLQHGDELFMISETEQGNDCKKIQKIYFLLNITDTWSGGSLTCGYEDGRLGRHIIDTKPIQLIPRYYCEGYADRSYRQHPEGCYKYVECKKIDGDMYPFGLSCNNDECFNFQTQACAACDDESTCQERTTPGQTTPTPTVDPSQVVITCNNSALHLVNTSVLLKPCLILKDNFTSINISKQNNLGDTLFIGRLDKATQTVIENSNNFDGTITLSDTIELVFVNVACSDEAVYNVDVLYAGESIWTTSFSVDVEVPNTYGNLSIKTSYEEGEELTISGVFYVNSAQDIEVSISYPTSSVFTPLQGNPMTTVEECLVKVTWTAQDMLRLSPSMSGSIVKVYDSRTMRILDQQAIMVTLQDVGFEEYSGTTPLGGNATMRCIVRDISAWTLIKVIKTYNNTNTTILSQKKGDPLEVISDRISGIVTENGTSVNVDVMIRNSECSDGASYDCVVESSSGSVITSSNSFALRVTDSPKTPTLDIHANFVARIAFGGYLHKCSATLGFPADNRNLGIRITSVNGTSQFVYSEPGVADRVENGYLKVLDIDMTLDEKMWIQNNVVVENECRKEQTIEFLLQLNDRYNLGNITCYVEDSDATNDEVSTTKEIVLIPRDACSGVDNNEDIQHPDGCNKWITCAGGNPFGKACDPDTLCYNVYNDLNFCEDCSQVYCGPVTTTTPATTTTINPDDIRVQCNSSTVENGEVNVRTLCILNVDNFHRISISKLGDGEIASVEENSAHYYGTNVYTVDRNFVGNPKTFSLVIPVVNCSYQGTYSVEVYLNANETSVIPVEFDLYILDKPDVPTLETSLHVVENSQNTIHSCTGYLGSPRGSFKIEVNKTDTLNFQEYPSHLHSGEETVTNMACGEYVEYKFGLSLPASFNLSTVRCRAENDYSSSSGDLLVSNSETITLIPDGYCNDISTGYKHHPLGCGYYVQCVNGIIYGVPTSPTLCFNFARNLSDHCFNVPECSGTT